jgi:hypothetical protein
MQERKRRFGRIKGLHRQMQHHGGILADRIQHHRLGECCGNLAENMDRFGFKTLKVRQALGHENHCPLFFGVLRCADTCGNHSGTHRRKKRMVSQPGANSRQFIAAGTMNERTSFQ